LNNEGKKIIFTYRDAEKNISLKLINTNKLNSKWFYITSLGGNFELLEFLFNYANKNNIKIMFNPGSLEFKNQKVLRFLNRSNIVIMNLDESVKLFEIENTNSILSKASSFSCDYFIILDEKGVNVVQKNKVFKTGFLNNQVKDLTGAGDAYGSGFLTGLLKKNNVAYALKTAAINSSNVVSKIGAQKGIVSELMQDVSLEIKEISI
jgi:sugar/nucleoside kinase (ribokinase family)